MTAMFKDPPEGLLGEAWRILLAATDGKQLVPNHVQKYWKRHVANCEGGEAVSDSTPATGPPPSKRGKRDTTRAEAETASASSLAAPAVLAPGLAPEPFVAGAKTAPSPPYPGNAGALPSSASQPAAKAEVISASPLAVPCLLYTSDAADE